MTEQQRPDWYRRFQDMKVGFQQPTGESEPLKGVSEPLKEINVDFSMISIDALRLKYQQFINWFNEIPASGKLLAIAGGGLLSMTLIKTVFQLITSLITLSTFGVILYLIYRFLILPKSNES
jgi:hypothetical protein